MIPTGTVTFLFTDIEGSTLLAQQFPTELPRLLARHHAILRQAFETHHGTIFQMVGDSYAVAFHTAQEGLAAGLEAQRRLHAEAWAPAPIRVRMGLHTGSAQARVIEDISAGYEGYFTIARAQRVMSVAYGGQVLLSNPTAELVRGDLPPTVTLTDLGEHRLKSLLNPERLWQMSAQDLPHDFPPLKSLNAIPNNLPVQLTSFIGREAEIAQVKQELARHRLVTLTGPGGTGKTRLSLQVVADLLDQFENGVWFIELAPLTDPEMIPLTILTVIGIREQPGLNPLDVLKTYLDGKKTLVILDNCEHLVEACARLANVLLNAAPGLKILASSHEALRVRGEMSFQVPSLTLPDPKHLPVVGQLSQYEAVRLFIDRVSLVSPRFDLTIENAPAIAQICYRLDGIPLAIELAASRVKMMSVEQISKRLDDRFRLLTGGARTALPRQQTLRALINWSYDLLSEGERLLLRRLTVFAGGWILEAAEQVCSGDAIEPYEVLDLLTQLVDKSLVIVKATSQSGETRYRMLETIHQYAREKLLEAGGGETLRQRHLAYFVRLAEQAEPELYRSNQLEWSNRLEDEIDNFRIALEWALTTDEESGLRIATLPWRLWGARGYLQEMGERLAQLLELYQTTDSLHSLALAIYSFYYFRQGNFSEMIRIADQSLQMARTLSDQQTEAFSLSFLGLYTLLQGNVDEGTRLLEQSLALYRALDDKIGLATTMEWLSIKKSDLGYAIACARESLGLHRELGNLSGIASSLTSLSRLTFWSGDLTSPLPWLEEARSIARQIGDRGSEAGILNSFGAIASWQGDYQQATAYYETAIQLCEEIGNHYVNLWAHVFTAYASLRQRDIQRARQLFEDCIRRSQKTEQTIVLVFAVEGLASLNVNQNEPERAARLFAWADAMREKIGDSRPPIEQASVDRDIAVIRSQLDENTFENAGETGRLLTQEQAIEDALLEIHR
jgi:predicted ATPase/class 3 adenylate cyclase